MDGYLIAWLVIMVIVVVALFVGIRGDVRKITGIKGHDKPKGGSDE